MAFGVAAAGLDSAAPVIALVVCSGVAGGAEKGLDSAAPVVALVVCGGVAAVPFTVDGLGDGATVVEAMSLTTEVGADGLHDADGVDPIAVGPGVAEVPRHFAVFAHRRFSVTLLYCCRHAFPAHASSQTPKTSSGAPCSRYHARWLELLATLHSKLVQHCPSPPASYWSVNAYDGR